ncbi:MAG: hypothetical protein PHY47_25800 [Lachnospiraceae bacterium]|nr:hypothetical protein [Lachnospiraceae bacterium]
MDKELKSSKWHLVINNPADVGMTHEKIKLTVENMKAVEYWCMCDEIGLSGIYHTHIFISFAIAKCFSKLKNDFPQAHIEAAKGILQDNRDYIAKDGKWEKDIKHEINLPDTFEEFSNISLKCQKKRKNTLFNKMLKCMERMRTKE